MTDEKLRLLKMIEEHKITAEEGAKLLAALTEAQEARERGGREPRRARAAAGDDLFWGRQREEVRDQARAERDHLLAERERIRDEARRERDRAREEGRRAAEEARRGGGMPTRPLGEPASTGKMFRVRVTDRETGTAKVDLRLPLGLVNFGLKVGARYLPEHITLDYQEVLEAVRGGVTGRIIEVNEPDSSERVEILIENQ